VRLVTGCAWVDAEFLCDKEVSDTTARARRDGLIADGVFERLVEEALEGYGRSINLALDDVSMDELVKSSVYEFGVYWIVILSG